MHDIYVYFASVWLEQKLLPLALQGAGLPPETSLEQLEAMDLPLVNHPEIADYANSEAATLCSQRPLFCATMLAESFLRAEKPRRMIRAIYGLMWRDGVEFAMARDLHLALCNEWFNDSEASARMVRAEDALDRWQATDADVLACQQDFLSDCVDQRLSKGLAAQSSLCL